MKKAVILLALVLTSSIGYSLTISPQTENDFNVNKRNVVPTNDSYVLEDDKDRGSIKFSFPEKFNFTMIPSRRPDNSTIKISLYYKNKDSENVAKRIEVQNGSKYYKIPRINFSAVQVDLIKENAKKSPKISEIKFTDKKDMKNNKDKPDINQTNKNDSFTKKVIGGLKNILNTFKSII